MQNAGDLAHVTCATQNYDTQSRLNLDRKHAVSYYLLLQRELRNNDDEAVSCERAATYLLTSILQSRRGRTDTSRFTAAQIEEPWIRYARLGWGERFSRAQ